MRFALRALTIHPHTERNNSEDIMEPGRAMDSPNLNERCTSSLSGVGGSRRMISADTKDDSMDNSARESVTERGSIKAENCRRRTIIVEKKNGSYGFTLQSYGIHYKKEQEVEVITYVDFVEKRGPAAAAGMREGDVILAINGIDVERADHQSVVATINACDSRMRMVVMFEDCVRKVELHIKYIKLQRSIQEKIKELDKLKIRERHLLDTNWKTHSLPSQKKKNSPGDPSSDADESNAGDDGNGTYCRPTLSSENVTSAPSQHSFPFKYQYLEPHYVGGACLVRPDLRTGSFVITVGSPRSRADCRHFVVKTPADLHRSSDSRHKDGAHNGTPQPSSTKSSSHRHGCTHCIPVYNNQDANSIDAYDLASPCCDPHCVPNARKKHRRKKECSKEKKKDKHHGQGERCYQKGETCQTRSRKPCSSVNCPGSRYRYLNADSAQTSQCSLQSYNNSSGGGGGGDGAAAVASCENSVSSYTTSLSSDTLFWETDRSESKASPKVQYHHAHPPHCKPKSWDNLTTKAVGGYGFGYGYLDTISKHTNRSKSHGRTHSARSSQSHHGYQTQRQSAAAATTAHHYNLCEHEHRHCFAPTKSTESLIVRSKYPTENGSEHCSACAWVEPSGAPPDYYRRPSAPKSPNDSRSSGYYSHHFVYPTHSYQKKDNVSSEITRL